MSQQSIDKLENELVSRLSPVRAPERMWESIEAELTRRKKRARVVSRVLILLPVGVALSAFWSSRDTLQTLEAEALAAHQEFLRHPDRLDFRQGNPVALCNWFGAHSIPGIQLATRPLPDPDSISFEGGRLLSSGRAVVFYRVGQYLATLLIARASGGASAKCLIRRFEPRHGVDVFSWEARGQALALVSSVPGASQAACFVCHVEPQHRQGILQMKFPPAGGA